MNATRHGLTGRMVVMPYEDMEAYYAFCKQFFEELAPETPLERQYAQTFCDTQWRPNRALSIEDFMYALGHFEAVGQIETDHPQVHASLTAARVFRDDSKSFVNLGLYEQRLQRTLDKSLHQLQALQAERHARPQSEQHAVSEAREPERPSARQFIFSNPEIEAELHRRLLLDEGQNAGHYASAPENPRDVPAKLAAWQNASVARAI